MLLAVSAVGVVRASPVPVPVADLPEVQRPAEPPGAAGGEAAQQQGGEAARQGAAERPARSAGRPPAASLDTTDAAAPSQAAPSAPPSQAPAAAPARTAVPDPGAPGREPASPEPQPEDEPGDPPPEPEPSSPPPSEPEETPTPTPTEAGFPPVPGCDAPVPVQGEVANGRLSDEHLCPIGDGHRLRPDAAAAFLALDEAYRQARGSGICVTDSYRNLDQQRELKVRKPRLAARPGTSNHGWGLAVDLACGAQAFDGKAYRWLSDHAPAYGWHNPPWARVNGSKPEPWHWEYEPSLLG